MPPWAVLLPILLLWCGEGASCGRFNPGGLPTLIWWTDMLFPHHGSSAVVSCPRGNCLSSVRRRKWNNASVPTAYLFYGSDYGGGDLPLPLMPHHRWALLHEESPSNNYIFAHAAGLSPFNYTATFSRHAHLPLTLLHLPSLQYLQDRQPLPPQQKDGLVLYLASHCGVASGRDDYVRHLQQWVHVDCLGECLRNGHLPPSIAHTDTMHDPALLDLIARYKFYLALENAVCEDYITEKLWRALHVGVVPVYLGSPSVRDWEPHPGALILVDDFSGPQELAEYLKRLHGNDTEYSAHLRFKTEGMSNQRLIQAVEERNWGVHDPERPDFVRAFECYVCDRLHGGEDLPPPDRTHMDCPPPGPPARTDCGTLPSRPHEWSQSDWDELYSNAYIAARAIRRMLDAGENTSTTFHSYMGG